MKKISIKKLFIVFMIFGIFFCSSQKIFAINNSEVTETVETNAQRLDRLVAALEKIPVNTDDITLANDRYMVRYANSVYYSSNNAVKLEITSGALFKLENAVKKIAELEKSENEDDKISRLSGILATFTPKKMTIDSLVPLIGVYNEYNAASAYVKNGFFIPEQMIMKRNYTLALALINSDANAMNVFKDIPAEEQGIDYGFPSNLASNGLSAIECVSDNIRIDKSNYNVLSFEVLKNNSTSKIIKLTFGNDIKVSFNKSDGTKQEVTSGAETIIDTNVNTIAIYDTKNTLKVSMAVTFIYSDEFDAIKVTDYFPSFGQFVNTPGWGANPEKTVIGSGGVSLGGFGGYLTYEFKTPIKNDAKNIGGMDFIVHGNSFNGNSEPANVYVSKDGKTWYNLAGASHYEDQTIWNYQLTYNWDGSKASWSDNHNQHGDLLTNAYHDQAFWPTSSNYGQWRHDGVIPDNYTVEGTLINGRNYAWGYVDGNASKNVNTNTPSLYRGVDGMDISWAVDNNGDSVYLDEVKYVKIQNATNASDGAFGELSAEVTGVERTDTVANQASTVTKTPVAKSITINNQIFTFEQNSIKRATKETDNTTNVITNTVYYTNESDDISVKITPSDTSDATYAAFIGEPQGLTRTFTSVPNKHKLRIVTANQQNEATIYLFNFEKKIETTENAKNDQSNTSAPTKEKTTNIKAKSDQKNTATNITSVENLPKTGNDYIFIALIFGILGGSCLGYKKWLNQ